MGKGGGAGTIAPYDCRVRHTESTALHVPSQPFDAVQDRMWIVRRRCSCWLGRRDPARSSGIQLNNGFGSLLFSGLGRETAGSWTIARVLRRKQLANWWSVYVSIDYSSRYVCDRCATVLCISGYNNRNSILDESTQQVRLSVADSQQAHQ